MTLKETVELIKDASGRMDGLYHATLFNEWAIISESSGKYQLLAYLGPREESFQKTFWTDLGSLREEFLGKQHGVGHFEFARAAYGTRFEAFIVAGKNIYVFANNTGLTMDELTRNTHWLAAQSAFADLSERFRTNPIVSDR